MPAQTNSHRRPRGTGSLFIVERRGRRLWYAKWRRGGRQVKRSLGPVREPGGQVGLTRSQAEAELRRELSHSAAPIRTTAQRTRGGAFRQN
jgi:hypothetical protein